jgi:hypothetical protein
VGRYSRTRPPGVHGNEEQAEGADDQDPREQDEVLRPEGCAKDEEFAFRQVPPDGLAQPDRTEIQQKQPGTAHHPQVAEQAGEGAGVDFFRFNDCYEFVVLIFVLLLLECLFKGACGWFCRCVNCGLEILLINCRVLDVCVCLGSVVCSSSGKLPVALLLMLDGNGIL